MVLEDYFEIIVIYHVIIKLIIVIHTGAMKKKGQIMHFVSFFFHDLPSHIFL